MDQKSILMLAAGGLLLVLIAGWLLGRSGRAAAPEEASADRLDTLGGWPPTATRILTTAERLAYDTLLRALPEYLILAQVPLARFLKVPTRNSYIEWLRRLGNQCADLVICDKATQVIAVVDVQAPTERASERSRKRLNRMARVLKAAGIPLHVWTEGMLPSLDTARATILPKAPAVLASPAMPAPVVDDATGRLPTPTPVAAPNPFEDPDLEPMIDEVIEAREPPLSTWFDEFNSGPTPLDRGRDRKK